MILEAIKLFEVKQFLKISNFISIHTEAKLTFLRLPGLCNRTNTNFFPSNDCRFGKFFQITSEMFSAKSLQNSTTKIKLKNALFTISYTRVQRLFNNSLHDRAYAYMYVQALNLHEYLKFMRIYVYFGRNLPILTLPTLLIVLF